MKRAGTRSSISMSAKALIRIRGNKSSQTKTNNSDNSDSELIREPTFPPRVQAKSDVMN